VVTTIGAVITVVSSANTGDLTGILPRVPYGNGPGICP
jgi:hypothetical protein